MTKNPQIAQDIVAIGQLDVTPMILRMAAQITGMRFTAIARVTDEDWIACAVQDLIAFGLKPGDELPLETTICNEIRNHHQAVVINQVSSDPLYRDHHTPKLYGFESYISLPIFKKNGDFFGTLCALDPEPAKLDEAVIDTLKLFAELIAAKLDSDDRLSLADAALVSERETSHMREQFMAVLGHDLKTPLTAVKMASNIIASSSSETKSQRLAAAIEGSAERMEELVDHILDFARGQLAGGIALDLAAIDDLDTWFQHMLVELKLAHGSRKILWNFKIDTPVICDRGRLSQLLSNLVNNAVAHGSTVDAIRIDARVEDAQFLLTVTNVGRIPDDVLPHLFQPFARSRSGRAHGLGLGLYIAAEIAKAHAGTLIATSPGENSTSFTLRFPIGVPQ